MTKYNFTSDGKNNYVLEIYRKEDLKKYVDYATELAMVEFRALLTLDDRGRTHNTWKSPITNISLAMYDLGGVNLIDTFQTHTDKYIENITNCFIDNGYIRINGNGAYSAHIDVSGYDSKEEVDTVPINLIKIETSCSNLILENDEKVDFELAEYMSENDLRYSIITNLRLAVKNGELMRGLSIIMDNNPDFYGVDLYIKTTGLDIDQIEALMAKLNKYFRKINYMIPDDKQYLIEELSQKYPKIEFVNISELSEV